MRGWRPAAHQIAAHPEVFSVRRGARSSADFRSGRIRIKTGADKSAGVREKVFRLAPNPREPELEIEDRVLLFRKEWPQRPPGGQRTVNSNECNLGRAVGIAQHFAQLGIGLLLRLRTNGALELHVNEQTIPSDDVEQLANLHRLIERAANLQTHLLH